MPKPPTRRPNNPRKETADLIRQLRAVPTAFLTRREKNRAIRAHARTFARNRAGAWGAMADAWVRST